MFEMFTEQIRRYAQSLRCLRSRQVENFPKYVGQAVQPVEALKHAERASDLDLFNQQRVLCFFGRLRTQARAQIFRKLLETQVQAFRGALLYVQDVINRDPVCPGLQLAAKVELGKVRYNSDQNFLSRILRVFPIAQHAQGKAINVALKRPDKLLESIAISVDCAMSHVLQNHSLWHPQMRRPRKYIATQ